MNASSDSTPINFLPAWYAQRRAQARRRQRHLIVCGVMVLVMAWAWMGLRTQAEQVEMQKVALEQRATAVDAQSRHLAELQREHDALAERVRRYREASRPIDLHRINAVLAELTPSPIFLRGLSAELVARKKKSANPEPVDARSAGGEISTETRRIILIDLEGTAPSNVEIANYVGRLSATPLFQEVKMIHARQGEVGEAATRQFKITMEVPLDRRYRFVGEGADHAD
jgi:Tfp pilus assembly protein PilN